MKFVVAKPAILSVMVCLMGIQSVGQEQEQPPAKKKQPIRILFIGNSYTGSAQVTPKVQALSEAAGVDQPLAVSLVAPGGYTFEDHWLISERARQKGVTENDTLKKLQGGDWDIVVLQSYTDAFLKPESFMKYGRLLAEEVKKKKARLIFYETWPCQKDKKLPTPDKMKKLNEVYFALAAETGGTVSPVGIAFEKVKEKNPEMGATIHRGGNDEHQSDIGAYLIACVHFATIYGKSPIGLPTELYRNEQDRKNGRAFFKIEKEMAQFLQTAASEAVEEARKLQAAAKDERKAESGR